MKKQLLNESDIRKMMKFANIGALTDGFVERLNEVSETTALEEDDTLEEDESLEEEKSLEEDDALEEGESLEEDDTLEEMKHDDKEGVQEEGMGGAYGKDDDMPPMDDEPVGDDMPPMDDEPMDDEMGAGGEMSLSEEEADVLIALGERLAAAKVDDTDELGAMADDEGVGMDADAMEDEPLEEVELDEDLVNEVLSRVARRLRSPE